MALTQVFRPLTKSLVIWADDWRAIGWPAGDGIPPKNQTFYQCRSTGPFAYVPGNYDENWQNNARKMIIHWEKPVTYGAARATFVPGVIWALRVSCRPANSYQNPPGTWYPQYISPGEYGLLVRVRAITENWDPATISWNNHKTALAIDPTPLAEFAWITRIAVAVDSGQVSQDAGIPTGSGFPWALTAMTAFTGPIYGIIIDCKPTDTTHVRGTAEGGLGPGSPVVDYRDTGSSITRGLCEAFVTATLDSKRCPKPYAIVPE